MEPFSSVLSSAQQGQSAALAELHRRYLPRVLARVRDRLASGLRRHVDTYDVAQSVFLDLFALVRRVEDRGERAFCNMLYVMAENKVRMKGRRHMGAEVRAKAVWARKPTPVAPGPATACSGAEETRRVRALVHTLDAVDRRIFELRYAEHLGYAAIARQLQLPSAAAARMRHSRALLRMRQRWTDSNISSTKS